MVISMDSVQRDIYRKNKRKPKARKEGIQITTTSYCISKLKSNNNQKKRQPICKPTVRIHSTKPIDEEVK